MSRPRKLNITIVIVISCTAGCSPPDHPRSRVVETQSAHNPTMHRHGTGPHGGIVFDLGKYHAEFALDSTKGECHLYILDDDEESPLAVAVKELILTIQSGKTDEAKSVPQKSIPLTPVDHHEGKTTRLMGRDSGLVGIAACQGTIAGVIDGKPSLGRFEWRKLQR